MIKATTLADAPVATAVAVDAREVALSSDAERNPVIVAKDGEAFTNSRDVAAFFDKDHNHVLRDIDILISAEPDLGLSRFGQTPWQRIRRTARAYRSYAMTRDGFTLLATGFTGPKALKWKLRYIEAFNAMEAELRGREGNVHFLVPRTSRRPFGSPLIWPRPSRRRRPVSRPTARRWSSTTTLPRRSTARRWKRSPRCWALARTDFSGASVRPAS